MSAAITPDIYRKEGDTYPVEATIFEGTSVYDLTGATALVMHIADEMADGVLLTSLTGTLNVDPATGKAEFAVNATAAALAPGKYYAEIYFEQGGYEITTNTFEYHLKPRVS